MRPEARDQELTDALRIRTLAVGLGSGVIVLAGLLPLEEDAPTLWSGLAGRALPLILLSAIGGVATLALLWVRRPGLARVPAVVAVAAVLSGWGLGQYPWLLVDEIRIADAAGAPATLQGLLVVTVVAAVLVLPSLAYLFSLAHTTHQTEPVPPTQP